MKFRLCKNYLLVLSSLIIAVKFSYSLSVDEELTLTQEQKQSLDLFKAEIVGRNISFSQPYMTYDLYLLKWLRAKDFNYQEAFEMLQRSLEWRKRNRIDGILKEKFPYCESNYPFWNDGQDFTGRPVGTADVAVWDVRKAMIAGKGDELYRFMLKNVEVGIQLIYDAVLKGYNVTQGTVIVNLDGFNIAQQGCIQCISLYTRFILEFENNYPGGLHRMFGINAPAAINLVLRIVLPLASSESAQALRIYGTNKKEWKTAILREIPADSIRSQFGGTKPFFEEDEFAF